MSRAPKRRQLSLGRQRFDGVEAMEEAMRLTGDVPFGWMLSLQTWLSARTAARRRRAAPRAHRPAQTGEARLRLLRIDQCGVAAERDFDLDLNWAVLMLEGQMTLDLDGRDVPLAAGEVQVGSAATPHWSMRSS